MAKVRIRKRGKTYSFAFEAGKKANGKRRVIEKGGYASSEEAYNAGIEAYTDYKHGNIGVKNDRISLSDFIRLWQLRVSQDIRKNTENTYDSIIKSKIIPYLGNTALHDLRPGIIDQWLQTLYKEGLSKNYITQCRTILKAALDYSVYPCEILKSNPCIYTRVPKNAAVGLVKRTIITVQCFNHLMLEYPLGNRLHIPLFIMYHTGMRLGETLGLTWDNINFESRYIVVNKQLIYEHTDKSRHRITTTKTEQSKRKIYVDDELLEELHKEKDRQKSLEIINIMDDKGYCYSVSGILPIREGFKKIDLVCVSTEGKIINRQVIIGELKKHELNTHSFRHTQATKLASAGIQPVTAARRLGHSRPATTLNIYTHDSDSMQKLAVSSLEMQKWETFFSS